MTFVDSNWASRPTGNGDLFALPTSVYSLPATRYPLLATRYFHPSAIRPRRTALGPKTVFFADRFATVEGTTTNHAYPSSHLSQNFLQAACHGCNGFHRFKSGPRARLRRHQTNGRRLLQFRQP